MRYVKTSQLQPGMRLARPIYNKLGVLLYERNTMLTLQGIASIEKFGLWGIYILEPAEPVPPLSKDDLEFEQFQTVSTFQLKDDLVLLLNGRAPKHLLPLAQQIIRKFGSLNHKLNFSTNLRSTADYVYKHSINSAILAAMMVQKLHYSYAEQVAIVLAALLHDAGLLFVPDEILEKGDMLLSPDERRLIKNCMEKGYQSLHPEYNDYKFPELTLQVLGQVIRMEHNIKIPLDKSVPLSNGTHVIHVTSKFDDLTSMNLDQEPISEVAALEFFNAHPDYYPISFVTALTKCIHILPAGRCVDFSNGLKGIIVKENSWNFTQPTVVLFSNNQRIDFTNTEVALNFQIKDIMKTMDTRIPVDTETLKKYVTDQHTSDMTKKYFNKRKLLLATGQTIY
ncbi:MAG: HD domain-containing protein [Lachnospiraceae bacterium]